MDSKQNRTLIKIGIDVYILQQKYKDEIDISLNKDGRDTAYPGINEINIILLKSVLT